MGQRRHNTIARSGSTSTPTAAPKKQRTASNVRPVTGCWYKSLLPILVPETCLDSHKARLGRAASTTARRRWDWAREQRTSGSQPTPRCRAPVGSRSRRTGRAACRSSIIDCGDDLHSNSLLLCPSTLLFWRSFHSRAWWESAESASFELPQKTNDLAAA